MSSSDFKIEAHVYELSLSILILLNKLQLTSGMFEEIVY
jgi:hypothetical protein